MVQSIDGMHPTAQSALLCPRLRDLKGKNMRILLALFCLWAISALSFYIYLLSPSGSNAIGYNYTLPMMIVGFAFTIVALLGMLIWVLLKKAWSKM